MKIYKRKKCSNFKPMPDVPSRFIDEPKCSHCAYFSTKNCKESYLDNIDYPDDDLIYFL